MPAIHKVLDELSREELVKRFVLRDFDRLLAYYKDAPDLNAAAAHRGGDASGGYERDRGRGRPQSGRGPRENDIARLRINLGSRNSLTPEELMSLINRATQGPKLQVGRIHITEHASFFQMIRPDAERILPALNASRYGSREVRVVMEPVPSYRR